MISSYIPLIFYMVLAFFGIDNHLLVIDSISSKFLDTLNFVNLRLRYILLRFADTADGRSIISRGLRYSKRFL